MGFQDTNDYIVKSLKIRSAAKRFVPFKIKGLTDFPNFNLDSSGVNEVIDSVWEDLRTKHPSLQNIDVMKIGVNDLPLQQQTAYWHSKNPAMRPYLESLEQEGSKVARSILDKLEAGTPVVTVANNPEAWTLTKHAFVSTGAVSENMSDTDVVKFALSHEAGHSIDYTSRGVSPYEAYTTRVKDLEQIDQNVQKKILDTYGIDMSKGELNSIGNPIKQNKIQQEVNLLTEKFYREIQSEAAADSFANNYMLPPKKAPIDIPMNELKASSDTLKDISNKVLEGTATADDLKNFNNLNERVASAHKSKIPISKHIPVQEAGDAVTNTANKIADKTTDALPSWATKAGLIVGGVVLAASVVNYGLHKQDQSRMNKQMRIAEKDRRESQDMAETFDKDLYYNLSELNGLPQQLYNNRNGHSNSWGGRKY